MRMIRTISISSLAVCLLVGSAVGLAAQDEPNMEVTEVTGRAIFGPWLDDPGVEETPDGIQVGEGFVFLHGWDMSDPRLNGEMTRTVNFRFDSEFANGIESVAYELSNEGGSWVGDGRGYGTPTGGSGFVALSGRDGYEGLSAFLVHEPGDIENQWELKGVIFPSTMPEVPEPYVPE